MPVGRSRQGTDQAGALAPTRSVWGAILDGSRGRMIDQPAPIGSQSTGFGGTVGGLFTVSANVGIIARQPGYFGDVPESQQGVVIASPPWERP